MEINILLILSYALWGLIVGLTVGFTSIGTGLLGTPGLIIIFNLDPVTAVGTMGITGFILMLSSVIQHLREKNVEIRTALLFSLMAVPASYFAAFNAEKINTILPLKNIIGFIIIFSTSFLFYRYVLMKNKIVELELPNWKLIASPFIGIIMGLLMGATSISGSIILLSLIIFLKFPGRIAVGTASAIACLSLAIAAAAHLQGGHINIQAAGGLIPGVIIGGTIGSKFVSKVPQNILRYAILIILVFAGIMVFLKT